jgi:hypothetical protein
MSKVLIQIEDVGDEIVFQAAIDPPLTEDKTIFSTAELVGLYLREHASDILAAAVAWAKAPDSAEEAKVQAPKLILPNDDGIVGAPV